MTSNEMFLPLYYSTNFKSFAEDLLGLRIKKFHEEWLEHFEDNEKSLLLAPRGSGKTIFTAAYVIWKIIQNPDIRILLVSTNQNLASDIMSTVRHTFEKNDKIKEIFGDFSNADGNGTWSNIAINVKKRSAKSLMRREKTLLSCGVGGRFIGSHFDLIILDDIVDEKNSSTEGLRTKLREWYSKVLLPTLERDSKMICIGCVTGDTKVLMHNNTWKDIKNVQVGDFVKSYHGGKLVDKCVSWSGCTGEDIVYNITTDSTMVNANSKHPFLVLNPIKKSGSNISDYELIWKRTTELVRGDMIISSHTSINNANCHLLNNVKVNKDFMWLYGYLMGDGWVTKRKHTNGKSNNLYEEYIIGVSYTNKSDELEKVKNLFKELFDIEPRINSNGCLIISNKKIGKMFYDMNLGNGAKFKEIPDWLFNLPIEFRQSFIKGLLKADGWKYGHDTNRYCIELTNKRMIKQLQLLSKISGLRTSNITHRRRYIKAPNSKKADNHDFYHLRISFNKHYGSKGFVNDAKNKYPYNNFGIDRVKSVKKLNKRKIYDITVNDTHNFIAEGLVTHNTLWHPNDIYSRFYQSSSWVTKKYKAIIKYPEDTEDGKAVMLWDREEFNGITLGFSYQDALNYIEENGKLAFEMQYQNEIIQTSDSPIKEAWIVESIQTFENIKRMPELTRYMGVDLASEGGKDYFSIVVIGVDTSDNIYVLDSIYGHYSMSRQLNLIKELSDKYNPIMKIGIESNATQRIITDEWRRTTKLPIYQIKSSWVNDKWSRIQNLSVKFETGRIYLNPKLVKLKDELLEFPRGTSDDLTDALSFAVQSWEHGRKTTDWSKMAERMSSRRTIRKV